VEVPIHIEQTPALSEENLQTLTKLPKTLMQEECDAYDVVVK